MPQGSRASEIDAQRDEQHRERQHARLDVHAAEKHAIKRFVNDVQGGQRQQAGLDERGKILKLPMTIEVPLIGRQVRHAHRKEGDDRGNQVQAGVQRFGKHPKASRADDQKSL